MAVVWWLAVALLGAWQQLEASPEAMARPVRPKSFASPDDLRTYLDQLGQYYAVAGRPRFGKRVALGPLVPAELPVRYQQPSELYDFLYQSSDD